VGDRYAHIFDANLRLAGAEGVPALRGVTLSIRRGEFVMLFGPSGGGKTSLLNIIGTVDRPTKGSVHLCGKRMTQRTPDEEVALPGFLWSRGRTWRAHCSVSSLAAVDDPASEDRLRLPNVQLALHTQRR
jgi:ABC-type branched-subunit amino acid transport system ATPase component